MATMREWVDRYAEALGVPAPSDGEIADLLELVGVAAHSSERTAAPVSCWLAAKAGVSAADAHATGQRVAADLPADG